MTKTDRARSEVTLAITALFQESLRLENLTWNIQLAPPPDHQYHKPEHLDAVRESLAKCNHAMKVLDRNLLKMQTAKKEGEL